MGISSISGAANRLEWAVKQLREYYGNSGRPDINSVFVTRETGETLGSVWVEESHANELENGSSTRPPDNMTEAVTETSSISVDPEIINDLIYMIIDGTEGAYFTNDMLTRDDLTAKFEIATGKESSKFESTSSIVKILYEPGVSDDKPFIIEGVYKQTEAGKSSISRALNDNINDDNSFLINKVVGNPDRFTSPTMSVFIFPDSKVSLATRSVEAISLYMNSIPVIERSRCVPYANIQFVSVTNQALGQKTKQLSTLRFLGMNQDNEFDKIGLGGATPINVLNTLKEDDEITVGKAISAAGMELFTSPQTMVNMDINSAGFKGPAGDVLNKLAPLMTLEGMTVDIVGLGQDLFAYKTGILTFVLHDRSRMSDIAPIIATDLYALTYLIIEFGWSHPDGGLNSDNAYGAFLNSLRSRGAFNIISTNFSIGDDGQVRFTLKFASRGAGEATSYPAATGRVMPVGPVKQIFENYIASAIKKMNVGDSMTKALSGVAPPESAEIRQKLRASSSAASSGATVIPRSLFNSIMAIYRVEGTDVEINSEDINNKIKELIGNLEDSEDSGLSSTSSKSLASEIKVKLDSIEKNEDPFLSESPSYNEIIGTKIPDVPLSLGSIIMSFVAAPLAATGKFDEVQLMFYKFNNQAGGARDYESIANFIVDKDKDLKDVLDKYIEKYPSISISRFMTAIIDNIVSKLDNPNYGLSDLRSKLYKEKTKKADSDQEKSTRQVNIEEIKKDIEDRLKAIYSLTGGGEPIFSPPKIRLKLECLPAYVYDDKKKDFILDNSKNVLRIHVFDAKASPHKDEMFLLAAANDSEIAIEIEGTVRKNSTVLDALKTADGGPSNGYNLMVTNGVSNKQIKDIIKQTVPSITLGSMFTAVNRISMQSSTSGLVNNVLLLNTISDKKTDHDVPGRSSETEDIVVLPASADMSTLGCPLFEYGQHFFVDMGTGTTADNMYYVTKISHSIAAGEFNTSVGLSFSGSGTISTFRSILGAAQANIEKDVDDQDQG